MTTETNQITTIYSTPNCIQCIATEQEMKRKGIPFEIVDLSQDKEAFQLVSDLGYKQAPIVITGENHWSGFRHDKIAGLINTAN